MSLSLLAIIISGLACAISFGNAAYSAAIVRRSRRLSSRPGSVVRQKKVRVR